MVRVGSLFVLVVAVLVLALGPAGAEAQDGGPIAIELVAPPLHAGDRAELIARVRGAGAHPLLVTPRSEGTAIEVVRGRLLRAEAVDPSADPLEFRVPVIAQLAGTAVVRVSVRGYACEARCRLVRAEASEVVTVAPARARPSAPKQTEAPDAPAHEASTSSLSWVRMPGAEACASSAALARAVEQRLARRVFVSAADADLAVEGRAERTDAGWRAVLSVTEADGTVLGERTLESAEPECDALGRRVALTVALMIDPLTPPPEAASEDPPETRIIVRTERVEVPVLVPAPAPPPRPRWRVEFDAAVLGAIGLLPSAALGGVAAVIVEPPGFVPLVLEGALLPFSRAESALGHADFLQVHAGLQICPLALREAGLALHGCLGADAGAVVVIGGDVTLDERERLIGQAHAVVRGAWDVIGPLTLRLAVHLLVPFRHEPFTLGGNAFYAPEPVAGMLDLGAGVHF
jgi:hypothetical protein